MLVSGKYNVVIDAVEIGTWWNVNLATASMRGGVKVVEIGTWWNVNVNVVKHFQLCVFFVEIDTWWNVNLSFLQPERNV